MGTNYYLETDECECCGRNESIHIGKSSCGWVFSLHQTNELKSLEDWIPKLLSGKIKDEYGSTISLQGMLNIITQRSFGIKDSENYGLWTIKDGIEFHIKSGNTWAMVSGEFS